MTRRSVLVPLVVLAGFLVAAPPASPQDGASAVDGISVREDRGLFTVTATFDVPQAAALAAAVLTDYDQIARFMPGVRKSAVVERAAGLIVVEQEAVARLLMFSKKVHLLLEVRQQGNVITFRDRCGRSFERYEGTWRIASADGRTLISYELTARPSFEVPDFILGRLLKRDAIRMIEGLRLEMARRSAP